MKCATCGGEAHVELVYALTIAEYRAWQREGGSVERWVAEPTEGRPACRAGCEWVGTIAEREDAT